MLNNKNNKNKHLLIKLSIPQLNSFQTAILDQTYLLTLELSQELLFNKNQLL